MFKNGRRPVHPGEVLREDYLKPAAMSANALARQLHVPASRVNDIVLERRGITADTALRLSRFFGGDAQSWRNCKRLTTCAWPNWTKRCKRRCGRCCRCSHNRLEGEFFLSVKPSASSYSQPFWSRGRLAVT